MFVGASVGVDGCEDAVLMSGAADDATDGDDEDDGGVEDILRKRRERERVRGFKRCCFRATKRR